MVNVGGDQERGPVVTQSEKGIHMDYGPSQMSNNYRATNVVSVELTIPETRLGDWETVSLAKVGHTAVQ